MKAWLWVRIGNLLWPGLGKVGTLRWRLACAAWAKGSEEVCRAAEAMAREQAEDKEASRG